MNEKREGSLLEQPDEKRRKPAVEMTWDELRKIPWRTRTTEEQRRWDEEYDKNERLMHSWWGETDRPLEQPPGVNYRRNIFQDEEKIERLLADHNLHFKDRCLMYRTIYFELEYTLHHGYKT